MEALISGGGTQMCMMLIVVALGYVVGKLGYFDAAACDGINAFLINVALPCLIVGSVAVLDPSSAQDQVGVSFGLAAIQFILFTLLAVACNYLFRVPRAQRGLYVFMNLCTNTGFFALPILVAVYGQGTVLSACIFILMCNLFIGSVGLAFLEYDGGTSGAGSVGARSTVEAAAAREGGSRWAKRIKGLLNAPLVACLIALAVFFTNATFPPLVQNTLEFLGGTCAPLAMLLVGAVLSRSKVSSVLKEWRMYGFIVVRQVLMALAAVFVLPLLGVDPTITAVFVIMCAAPVGSMVPAWAGRYGRDVTLGATGTVLSTVSCFLVYPLLIAVMAVA